MIVRILNVACLAGSVICVVECLEMAAVVDRVGLLGSAEVAPGGDHFGAAIATFSSIPPWVWAHEALGAHLMFPGELRRGFPHSFAVTV